MTIYIVRHGQTEENLQRILQGHMPGTLTEKGKRQVHKTSELLSNEGGKFTRIVSSDLKRAMDSAKIISDRLNLPIIPMKIFRERDWGELTGMSIADAMHNYHIEGKWVFPEANQNRRTYETNNQSMYETTSEQSNSLEFTMCKGEKTTCQGIAETEEGIYERACNALAELQKLFDNETIIVVTHGQFARNLIAAHLEYNYHEVSALVNAEI